MDHGYLNAAAEECSAPVIQQGQRAVRYMGEEYYIMGLYFARSHNGPRKVFYVLRPIGRNGQGTYSSDSDPKWEVHR